MPKDTWTNNERNITTYSDEEIKASSTGFLKESPTCVRLPTGSTVEEVITTTPPWVTIPPSAIPSAFDWRNISG